MSEIAALEPTAEDVTLKAEYIAAEFGKHGTKGIGSRIPPQTKAIIYTLADSGKLSHREIADRVGLHPTTVKGVLLYRDDSASLARNFLQANSLRLVTDWMLASRTGAKKGRHEPARDALYALNVVQPPSQVQAHQSVTVVLSGGELPQELRVGIQQVTRLSPPSTE